ncbi:MAG: type II secretion system F family protein [Gammaproteobacteria bacterium]|nr:type II secretion system F family protein [Gammaproteobacteria bacterium]
MRVYVYSALDRDGDRICGTLRCANIHQLKCELSNSKLILLKARRRWGNTVDSRQQREFEAFALQLGLLLQARLSLLDALQLISGSEKSSATSLAGLLLTRVQDGQSLSEIAREMPDVFGRLAPALFDVGERTGNLSDAVSEVHKSLEQARKSRQQLRQAMMYPLLVAISLFLVSGFLLLRVIPDLAGLLTSLNADLHWTTLSLVRLSLLLSENTLIILLVAALAVMLFTALLLHAGVRQRLATLQLRVPLLGSLLLEIRLNRFSSALATLLMARVNLLEALAAARPALGLKSLEDGVRRSEKAVLGGSTLSQALRGCVYFPEEYCRLIEIGESTDSVAPMLLHVADYYEQGVRLKLRQLEVRGAATLLILMGGLLIGMVVAVLGPLYGSFSQISLS